MAAEKNRLRIAVWEGYDDLEAARPFCERHDVVIDPVYVDSDWQNLAVVRESIGKLDLVALDNRFVKLIADSDLLTPLDYSRLPNTKDYLSNFNRLRLEAGSDRFWSAPYIWGTAPLMYNAAHVTEAPRSWRDIVRDEYKGKVVIVDEPVNQIIIWARVLGYDDPTRMTQSELARVAEYVGQLKRQVQARLVRWGEIPDLLAEGDAWLSTGGWEAISNFAAQRGADIRWVHPEEGDHGWMDSWCIPLDAPNEDTAYAWIDWMIGVEAQRAVCSNLPCGTVNAKAVELLDEKTRGLVPYEDLHAVFRNGGDFALPPSVSAQGIATLDDWRRAWRDVQAA